MSKHLPTLPDFTEHTIDSEMTVEGKLIRVRRDRVRLVDGSESIREYVLHPGAVIIAAYLDDETLVFEHQYRYPPRNHYLELPAGKIDHGEQPLEAARRELLEETGYTAKYWKHAVTLDSGIGFSNEKIELFIAEDLTFVGHNRDEGEFLESFPLNIHAALDMIRDGKITDTKSAFSVLWLDKFSQHVKRQQ